MLGKPLSVVERSEKSLATENKVNHNNEITEIKQLPFFINRQKEEKRHKQITTKRQNKYKQLIEEKIEAVTCTSNCPPHVSVPLISSQYCVYSSKQARIFLINIYFYKDILEVICGFHSLTNKGKTVKFE